MRWSPAPRGGIAVVLGLTAACGHTEPAVYGDAIALAPASARSIAPDASDRPGKVSALSLPEAIAASEADMLIAGADAGENKASDVPPTAHCLEDAGAPARTLIRFVNRPVTGPENVRPACHTKQLILQIPSMGFVSELCNSGCGPFNFDSQKKGTVAATFTCDNDFFLREGTAWVADGVLFLEVHDDLPPEGLFDGPRRSAAPSRPRPPHGIPLPCGTRAEIRTAGRLFWTSEGPEHGHSSR